MTNASSKAVLGALAVASVGAFATPSWAQTSAPPESVIVTAPRYDVGGSGRVNTIPEKVSLSKVVRYDDLDLRSSRDATILYGRVREAVRDVCWQLKGAFPLRQLPGTSCYKTALQNGLIRADAAIRDARQR